MSPNVPPGGGPAGAPLRIVIVGAGIGGLALALALRRRGLTAAVFERAPTLRPAGAGIALGPNAMVLLDGLGVGARVAAAGRAVREALITDPQGRPLQRLDLGRVGGRLGADTVAVHRARLHQALLAPLRAAVRTGAEVVGVEPRGERVAVTLAGAGGAPAAGETVEADLVVGADGVRSATRRLVFGGPPPRYAGYTSWRFVVPQPRALPDSTEMWGRGRRLGLVPLGGGELYGFAVVNAPQGAPDAPADRLARVRAAFAGFGGAAPEVLRSVARPEQLIPADIEEVVTGRWVHGRVALLGDAAHAMTPDLGQGAGMAIEDAVVLADLLAGAAEGGQVDHALAAYQDRRLRRVGRVQDASRAAGRVAQWSAGPAVGLRALLLRALPASVTERRLEDLLMAGPAGRPG